MSLLASGKLSPNEFVETLISLNPSQLEEEPFGPLVLLFRAPDDDDTGQFIKVLEDCVKKEASSTGEFHRWPATSQFPTMRVNEGELEDADQIELLSELASAPHCIIPLRKAMPSQGYLIGRAPQAEIQLSDPSVSSSHGRISVEDSGVGITDIGSKNGTTLNGKRLSKGESSWLQPMDRLTFGRVQAFACAPRVLRMVLRQDLRTLV